MPTGRCKWFNAQMGYGFIQPDEVGDGIIIRDTDIFVHASAVEKAQLGILKEGQRLEYDIEEGMGGKTAAVNLREAR